MEVLIARFWDTCRPLDFVILVVLLYNTWKVKFLTKLVLKGVPDGKETKEKNK
jgi:hypothetical protein